MKTASILLALVVVLGFVREAEAWNVGLCDRTIEIGGQTFGLIDWFPEGTKLYAGPIGTYQVPFTATQGLIGFCCILAMLIIVPVVLTVRWKKKRVAAWN